MRSLAAITALGIVVAGCGQEPTTNNGTAPNSSDTSANHSVSLAWEGPTTNADTAHTPLVDLAGYRVYISTTAGQYPNAALREISASTPGATEQTTINNLVAGTYYFIVTARDTSGNESVYSDEISVTLP
jgi:hypothetical protein